MSFEQMQSTMQFIVEQQAQHAVLMHKYEERVGQLEAAFVTLTELARNVDERMDSHEERMDSLDEHLKTQIESLHAYLQAQSEDFYARLAADRADFDARRATDKADFDARRAADKADFDFRLAASREEFNRHLSESTERGRAIDQRLDKLSDLIERDVRRRNGEP
jgi:chromosome segregation ATPase